METRKYHRQFVVITAAAAVASILWLFWTIARSCNTFNEVGFHFDESIKALQIIIIAGYNILPVILISLLFLFLGNQLKSLKSGILFNKTGYRHLIVWASLWPIYDICAENIHIVWNPETNAPMRTFIIENTAISIPLVVLTFALLYKIAAQVAEENKLTI